VSLKPKLFPHKSVPGWLIWNWWVSVAGYSGHPANHVVDPPFSKVKTVSAQPVSDVALSGSLQVTSVVDDVPFEPEKVYPPTKRSLQSFPLEVAGVSAPLMAEPSVTCVMPPPGTTGAFREASGGVNFATPSGKDHVIAVEKDVSPSGLDKSVAPILAGTSSTILMLLSVLEGKIGTLGLVNE